MTPLSGWENFYVIVGSSAGALIGLQFVVITLIANSPAKQDQALAGSAFATPTIVHFSVVLLLAGAQCAPWSEVRPIAIIWGGLGVGGMVYEMIVTRRMRVQKLYKPVFEDWSFHVLLPIVAYATIAGAALIGRKDIADPLFAVGAAALLLLFVGIHNAWDAVTYHVFSKKEQRKSERTMND
jgi:hypothetical protein